MLRIIVTFLLAVCLLGCALPLWAADSPSQAIGLTLLALAPEDQEAIAEQLGQKAGVLLSKVVADSPAAKAGCVQGEVVIAIDKKYVDSPKAFDEALAGKTGTVELVGFIIDKEGKPQVVKRTVKLPDGKTPAPGATNPPPAGDPDAETQKKLKALEEAHKAGILSDEEYAKKREELLKKAAPAIDAETQKKLKALEDAHNAGILTDEEYAKKKAELLKTAPAGTAQKPAYDTTRKGKQYQHPIGFSFWYPEGWTVKEVDDALQLVPANVAMQNNQPAEVYFITGQPLEGTGITDVNDAQVIAFLDQLVTTKVSPALQRAKQPAPVTMTNGKGILLEWEAQGQGVTVHARTYACIMKGYGIILGAFGLKEKVMGRESELTGIFASFGMEAGKQDPAVAGGWRLFSTREMRNEDNLNFTTDDPRRASSVSNEQTTLELRPDGTAVRTSLYRLIAGGGAAGGNSTVWIDTGDQKEVKQGKWNAGNGTLFIMWNDGSMDSWKYGLVNQGGAVALKLLTGNKVAFWNKVL